MGAGASGHVRAFGADVHSPGQQPGATAVGPGVLPLPEAPGSLAEGPAGPSCLLCLLAQKGSASLLLAGSLLLPSGLGIHLGSKRLLLLLLLTAAPCQNDCCAMMRCAVSSAMLVKIVLEQEVAPGPRPMGIKKKRKAKTTPFGVHSMRSQVFHQAAQSIGHAMCPSLPHSTL